MQHDIESFIRSMNLTWQAGRTDELQSYFAENVYMALGPQHEPVVGIDAMIESYRSFSETGIIHSFVTRHIDCHEVEGGAVCRMDFEVDYEMNGERFQERGTKSISSESATPV